MKIILTNTQRQNLFHSVEEKINQVEFMSGYTSRHTRMIEELRKITEPSPYFPEKPRRVTIDLSVPFVRNYLKRESKDLLKYFQQTIKEVEKIGKEDAGEYWWDEKASYQYTVISFKNLLSKLK